MADLLEGLVVFGPGAPTPRAFSVYSMTFARGRDFFMEYAHPAVRGLFSEAEGRLWASQCRGRLVLELGLFKGLSAIIAARVAEHVTSVDKRDAADARANIEAFGLSDRVTILAGEIAKVVPTIAGTFGAVLIDSGHSRAEVERDIGLCLPKLEPGAVLGFHNYADSRFPDVKPTVDGFAARYGWQFVGAVGTLAVYRLSS
jgi:SAM-dependent methyltransferase